MYNATILEYSLGQTSAFQNSVMDPFCNGPIVFIFKVVQLGIFSISIIYCHICSYDLKEREV